MVRLLRCWPPRCRTDLSGGRRQAGLLDQPRLLPAPGRPRVALRLLPAAEGRPVEQLPLLDLGGVGRRAAPEPADVDGADLVLDHAPELGTVAVARQCRADPSHVETQLEPRAPGDRVGVLLAGPG